jgi:predicted nucleic acid-binding protein
VRLSGILTCEQDHRILECVLAVEANVLITGNKKYLQPLKTFRGISIVSPREFFA